MDTKAILKSWRTVNNFLRDCTLKEAQELLKAERGDLARPRFMLRIHGRLSVLRDREERESLVRSAK